MERIAKFSAAGMYLYICNQYGKLAQYYAYRYAKVFGLEIMQEDFRIEIIYEMMKVYQKYSLRGRPSRELEKIVKTVPAYYYQNKLNRVYNQRKLSIHEIQIEDPEKIVALYDKLYEYFIAHVPSDSDEKELLFKLIYETDILYGFSKGKSLSQAVLMRFFRKHRNWTRPKFLKVWAQAGEMIRSAVA